jgi:hemerythrin superfamily protein
MFGIGESPNNAITLLTADHRKVDQLFKEFEAEENGRRKVELATQICNELTVHATAEEEIFYPQALAAFSQEEKEEDGKLIWEATVEHGTLEGLIASLSGMQAEDESFEAHVKVLQEYVKHHVREEENEIFPKVRRTELDLDALGERIAQRKEELKEEMGLNGSGKSSSSRSSSGRSSSGRGDAGGASRSQRSKSSSRGRGDARKAS